MATATETRGYILAKTKLGHSKLRIFKNGNLHTSKLTGGGRSKPKLAEQAMDGRDHGTRTRNTMQQRTLINQLGNQANISF